MIDFSKGHIVDFAKRYANNGTTVPTLFSYLNEELHGGLRAGEVALVQARSGQGKSTFIDNTAVHVARHLAAHRSPKVVYVFLLEMTPEERAERLAHLFSAKTTRELITLKKYELPKLPLIYVDSFDYNNAVEGIAQYLQIISRPNPALILIDYVGKLRDLGQRNWSDYEELSARLEKLAKQFQCPVMGGSQVTTSMDFNPNHDLLDDRHIQGGKALRNSVTLFLSLNQSAEQRSTNRMTIYPFKSRRGSGEPFEVYADLKRFTLGDLVNETNFSG